MELRKHDLGYAREIAFLGDSDEATSAGEKLVREHNIVVARLRAVFELQKLHVVS